VPICPNASVFINGISEKGWIAKSQQSSINRPNHLQRNDELLTLDTSIKCTCIWFWVTY